MKRNQPKETPAENPPAIRRTTLNVRALAARARSPWASCSAWQSRDRPHRTSCGVLSREPQCPRAVPRHRSLPEMPSSIRNVHFEGELSGRDITAGGLLFWWILSPRKHAIG